ncbi:9482_t:CDS:1 [Acaulospora morrowiae]|uniref:9482_t:CDS:1 n=1 Tax=Acaulospora morrowiae TaxID=94023 RepID=A0A9N8YYZ7_9GLOM|nr:9482_t:CDS:1 [Acaulospora morrowiae]
MSDIPINCLEEIFKYLEDDRYSFYSFLLVNRNWCNAAVPIIWREHWSPPNAKIIETYLACLPEQDRDVLLDQGVDLPDAPEPLFNYPRYLKILDCAWLEESIYAYLTVDGPLEPEDIVQLSSMLSMICKLIINCTDGLRGLEVGDWKEHYNIPELASLPRVRKALSGLNELHIHGTCYTVTLDGLDNLSNLITVLTHFSNNIQFMNIDCCHVDKRLGKRLPALIASQNNLRHLLMEDTSQDSTLSASLISALSNQFNSLRVLAISRFPIDEVFLLKLSRCTKLESMNIFHCRYVEGDNILLQRIKSQIKLSLSRITCLNNSGNSEILSEIIEMAKQNLTVLVTDDIGANVLQSLSTSCVNLEYFMMNINTEIIPKLSLLLELNIKHLILHSESTSINFTTEMLVEIGQSLPLSLEYLDIDFVVDSGELEVILRECRAGIKRLGMKLAIDPNVRAGVNDQFLEVIINYAKRREGKFKELRIDRGREFLKDKHFSKGMLARTSNLFEISHEYKDSWNYFR